MDYAILGSMSNLLKLRNKVRVYIMLFQLTIRYSQIGLGNNGCDLSVQRQGGTSNGMNLEINLKIFTS